MEALVEEFGHPTYVSFPVIAARLFLAAIFGAVIGYEREVNNRPAGLRTHILVCVAAATFGILTVEIAHAPMFEGEFFRFDPIRAVEAVTAGIAFLAAGTILFAKGEVHGLTTGAGMWLAGAIGLAAGLGFWQIAGLGTLFTLIVLVAIQAMERKPVSEEGKSAGRGPGKHPAGKED
jgi:putative Mg2+ transporter-C (MgtC) family protein